MSAFHSSSGSRSVMRMLRPGREKKKKRREKHTKSTPYSLLLLPHDATGKGEGSLVLASLCRVSSYHDGGQGGREGGIDWLRAEIEIWAVSRKDTQAQL